MKGYSKSGILHLVGASLGNTDMCLNTSQLSVPCVYCYLFLKVCSVLSG